MLFFYLLHGDVLSAIVLSRDDRKNYACAPAAAMLDDQVGKLRNEQITSPAQLY